MPDVYCLQITEANHDENEFFTLGGAGFESEAERDANLAEIPALVHNCKDPAVHRCYIVDILDADLNIVSDKEISEETAKALLGVDDLGPLREKDRELVALTIAAAREARS